MLRFLWMRHRWKRFLLRWFSVFYGCCFYFIWGKHRPTYTLHKHTKHSEKRLQKHTHICTWLYTVTWSTSRMPVTQFITRHNTWSINCSWKNSINNIDTPNNRSSDSKKMKHQPSRHFFLPTWTLAYSIGEFNIFP